MKINSILPNSTCRLWCRIEKYKGGLCSDCPTELLSLLPNNQPCSLWEELHHLQVWSDGKLITLISIQEKTFIVFGEHSFIFVNLGKGKSWGNPVKIPKNFNRFWEVYQTVHLYIFYKDPSPASQFTSICHGNPWIPDNIPLNFHN